LLESDIVYSEGQSSTDRLARMEKDLLHAADLEPKNKSIYADIKKVKQKRKESEKKQNSVYKNMFG